MYRYRHPGALSERTRYSGQRRSKGKRTSMRGSIMKVMITGAAGFIGGFLAKHGLEAGCSVLGLGISEPEEAWADGAFEHCDIRDAARLSQIISAFRPDRIFHLAAQS